MTNTHYTKLFFLGHFNQSKKNLKAKRDVTQLERKFSTVPVKF